MFVKYLPQFVIRIYFAVLIVGWVRYWKRSPVSKIISFKCSKFQDSSSHSSWRVWASASKWMSHKITLQYNHLCHETHLYPWHGSKAAAVNETKCHTLRREAAIYYHSVMHLSLHILTQERLILFHLILHIGSYKNDYALNATDYEQSHVTYSWVNWLA